MHMIEWWGFFALTIMDFATALIIFLCSLNERMLQQPAWYKISLIAAAFGFASQGALNLPYLIHGIQLYAHAFPIWILKDVGIAMVACHYFWQIIRDKQKLRLRFPSAERNKLRKEKNLKD
ncbi:hypothetical protein ACVWV0_002355 [Ewingella americana]|uniref:Uncharacterized protein n=3 Tax=Ewingella americana TaxID=41202 RepID=A0A085G3H7_EWIA3|nr:hypothetical protein GEAM_3881 [Ewingella americana ATCC 33852]STQ46839.1 Uncharacterised protein [Ewingella americana]